MHDPCTPPPGTPDGTRHWLERQHGWRIGLLWGAGKWAGKWDSFKPEFLARLGWRYIGPVEADTPTGIPADWTDCPKCGVTRRLTKSESMRLIGNSVPKRMAFLLARTNIVHALDRPQAMAAA